MSAVSAKVFVTGTRTALDPDRIPVSTSLVTREEMETQNVNEVDQVLSLIEGVNACCAKGPADSDFQNRTAGLLGTCRSLPDSSQHSFPWFTGGWPNPDEIEPSATRRNQRTARISTLLPHSLDRQF